MSATSAKKIRTKCTFSTLPANSKEEPQPSYERQLYMTTFHKPTTRSQRRCTFNKGTDRDPQRLIRLDYTCTHPPFPVLEGLTMEVASCPPYPLDVYSGVVLFVSPRPASPWCPLFPCTREKYVIGNYHVGSHIAAAHIFNQSDASHYSPVLPRSPFSPSCCKYPRDQPPSQRLYSP